MGAYFIKKIKILLLYNTKLLVHNILFLLLCTLQYAHHQKFSFHSSPDNGFLLIHLFILYIPHYPSGYHYSVLCTYMFGFVWFVNLFLFVSIFHKWVKSYDISFSLPNLFYLA